MPVESFPTPQGIVFVRVNSQTGRPASGAGTIFEAFIEGTTPKDKTGGTAEEKEDIFR